MIDEDDDLNTLSDLWISAEPSPDLSELKEMVAKAARRDRLLTIVEYAVTAIVGLGILAVMMSFPEPRILASGAALFAGLVATGFYIRHLQLAAQRPEHGDTYALLSANADRIRARIKRYKMGLYAFIPAAFIGSLMGHFIADDGTRAETIRDGLGWLAGWPLLLLGAVALVLVGTLSNMLLQREKAKLARSEHLLAELAEEE